MLGIDVSKAQLVCTLVDPVTEKARWHQVFDNSPRGIQALLQRTPPDVSWVVEPTGRYSHAVVRDATQAGRRVLMAPTRRAKAFLASLTEGVKTDRVDSHGLGRFGLSQRLPVYRLKSESVEQLEQLQAARKGLSLSLSRLEQQARELPYAASHLQTAIAGLQAQRQALDAEIAARLAESEHRLLVRRLQAVPGIGPVTAVALACCLVSKQFTHPDQLVHYVGLSVTPRRSGTREGVGRLRGGGHAELRRLLFLGARSNLRIQDSPFRQQYERERAKGLSGTAAVCAVARKMARVCWSLWKHEEEYDPARVYSPLPSGRGRTPSGTDTPSSAAPAEERPAPEHSPAAGQQPLGDRPPARRSTGALPSVIEKST